jgi:hypothetical protein
VAILVLLGTGELGEVLSACTKCSVAIDRTARPGKASMRPCCNAASYGRGREIEYVYSPRLRQGFHATMQLRDINSF